MSIVCLIATAAYTPTAHYPTRQALAVNAVYTPVYPARHASRYSRLALLDEPTDEAKLQNLRTEGAKTAAWLQSRASDAEPSTAPDVVEPPAPAAMTEPALTAVKAELRLLAARGDRGLKASRSVMDRLRVLTETLEAAYPASEMPTESPQLLGDWLLDFTDAADVLSLGLLPGALLELGDINQVSQHTGRPPRHSVPYKEPCPSLARTTPSLYIYVYIYIYIYICLCTCIHAYILIPSIPCVSS